MDGHGLYIWTAYGLTLVVIAVNLWWPSRVRKQLVREEKQVIARNESGKQT